MSRPGNRTIEALRPGEARWPQKLKAFWPKREAPRAGPMTVDAALALAQPFPPRMHPDELRRFLELLAGARRYLEFGMGGSTVLAAAHPLERIWCVDTSRDWIEKCGSHPSVRKAIAQGRMTLRHIDIGPTREWGRPADKDHMQRWPEYYLAIWRDIAPGTLDFVFVDGRWRVECILQALLRVSSECMLGLHDFSDERPRYKTILEFVDVVDQTRSLLTFRRKPDVDW